MKNPSSVLLGPPLEAIGAQKGDQMSGVKMSHSNVIMEIIQYDLNSAKEKLKEQVLTYSPL